MSEMKTTNYPGGQRCAYPPYVNQVPAIIHEEADLLPSWQKQRGFRKCDFRKPHF
jgi:hypothetical protein